MRMKISIRSSNRAGAKYSTEEAVVLDARLVEVGQVAAVVDDALGVRVREAHACEGGVLERRLASRGVPELDVHERMAASTSSRLRSISSGVRASRFSRS